MAKKPEKPAPDARTVANVVASIKDAVNRLNDKREAVRVTEAEIVAEASEWDGAGEDGCDAIYAASLDALAKNKSPAAKAKLHSFSRNAYRVGATTFKKCVAAAKRVIETGRAGKSSVTAAACKIARMAYKADGVMPSDTAIAASYKDPAPKKKAPDPRTKAGFKKCATIFAAHNVVDLAALLVLVSDATPKPKTPKAASKPRKPATADELLASVDGMDARQLAALKRKVDKLAAR